ncbi:uncharacterized protein [Antennarius striatus]|uniref:uncharacterized protein isoform X2 n=1 Tax=Antennarius striatus TaxID=241820 RepID=UPI0035AEDD4F
MSVELLSASRNDAVLQSTTVGGSKPLHRFIKGQPSTIIVLVMGSSFFIVSIAIMWASDKYIWRSVPPGFVLGVLFIISGILYIVTEHNPTKKTVTVSLALSIVSLLAAFWTIFYTAPSIAASHYYRRYDFPVIVQENETEPFTTDEMLMSSVEIMALSVEAVYLFYSITGAIIFIVMSILAGAALRSTRSMAVVLMSTAATGTQVE